nr:response regulator [uncultured Flavobacterium sp.]
MILAQQTLLETPDFWKIAIASLFSVVAITIAYKNYKKKSPNTSSPIQIENKPIISPTNNNTNHLTVNFGSKSENSNSENKTPTKENDDIEKLRKSTSILFIDDDTKFKVVKILVNEGWINTKSITDLKSYNDDIIKSSDIVFVDVQGVGKILECKDEGLGLALNIKSKYSNKKVVIYSAVQIHNVFHDAIQKVDFLLSKDAEPYEFISLIERFSKELK